MLGIVKGHAFQECLKANQRRRLQPLRGGARPPERGFITLKLFTQRLGRPPSVQMSAIALFSTIGTDLFQQRQNSVVTP